MAFSASSLQQWQGHWLHDRKARMHQISCHIIWPFCPTVYRYGLSDWRYISGSRPLQKDDQKSSWTSIFKCSYEMLKRKIVMFPTEFFGKCTKSLPASQISSNVNIRYRYITKKRIHLPVVVLHKGKSAWGPLELIQAHHHPLHLHKLNTCQQGNTTIADRWAEFEQGWCKNCALGRQLG